MREELYAQTFDELIREVTINCAERGLLLLRVRDEMRMTIAAYQVGTAAGCSTRDVMHRSVRLLPQVWAQSKWCPLMLAV